MSNKLENMWADQKSFMDLLVAKRGFPKFPVDLTSKDGQRLLKTISYECSDELHEARQLLKQKNHRATEIREVDRDSYIEELTDAAHYLIELVVASGITLDEFYEAYMRKGAINRDRIHDGY